MLETVAALRPNRRLSDLPNDIRLVDAYNYWYDVISAETDELLELAYRLRYQVYCCENQFESAEDNPGNREIDEYDFKDRSVHSLLIDRSTDLVAGTVRIILPDANALDACFPTQQFCSRQLLSERKIPLATTAEVSRFAISRIFRNESPGDATYTDFPVDRQALAPYLTLGLIRGLIQMSLDHGITDWFAVMEPALLRLLSRFGIYFKPLGSLINYHGMRQPSHIKVNDLLVEAYRDKFDIWQVLTNNGRIFSQRQRQVC